MIWLSRSLILRSVEKRPRRLRLEVEIVWHSKCNRLYQVFVCFHSFRRKPCLYMYIYTCFTQVATPDERKGSSVSPHVLAATSVAGKPKVRSEVANPETWWPNRLHTSQISNRVPVELGGDASAPSSACIAFRDWASANVRVQEPCGGLSISKDFICEITVCCDWFV